ncbi:carboxylating nicotinate-nucleotide diphosphorylase [bacterium]|nr:carboxylating nicotinate-nucleotide diphosphorylase [bacterium]
MKTNLKIPPGIDQAQLEHLINLGLIEDIGQDFKSGDVTTNACVPAIRLGTATLLAKEELVVCGLFLVSQIFAKIDPTVQIKELAMEGSQVKAGAVLCEISGPLRSLLTAERLILNFIQRLSGIATQARRLQALVAPVKLYDTRKTIPGFRALDKYAVRIGGAVNHRRGLYDAFLIKNNHIDALDGDIVQAINKARLAKPRLKLEVEVRDLNELSLALSAKPDAILLDNFSPADLAVAVKHARSIAPQIELEASGGIDPRNLEAYAQSGVDAISMGALTHSIKAADLSLHLALVSEQ